MVPPRILLFPLILCNLLCAEQWVQFDLSDQGLNPANALEGPLPQSQSPSLTVDEVSAGDWIRGPGLRAVYLAKGFAAVGWTGPDGDSLRYKYAVQNGMYLEWSISPRAQQALRVEELIGILRHTETAKGRLTEFEWQWSTDEFLSGPDRTMRFSLADATKLASGVYRLPALNFKNLSAHLPLTGFQRWTVRLYVWDHESFIGATSAFSILGWVQPPEGHGNGVRIRVNTTAIEPWEERYQNWAQLNMPDVSDSGPLQDASGDGITNLIAFVTGHDPLLQIDSPHLLTPMLELIHIKGEQWLRLSRHPQAHGLRIIFEESPDLQAWRQFLTGTYIDSPQAIYFRTSGN